MYLHIFYTLYIHGMFQKYIFLRLYYRFLSTQIAFRSLASFKIAHTTVINVVYQNFTEIWEKLDMKHMPFPTTKMLRECAEEFSKKKSSFPNCFGCID
jgi:hypothetical protein